MDITKLAIDMRRKCPYEQSIFTNTPRRLFYDVVKIASRYHTAAACPDTSAAGVRLEYNIHA